jgi:hypothetical protein
MTNGIRRLLLALDGCDDAVYSPSNLSLDGYAGANCKVIRNGSAEYFHRKVICRAYEEGLVTLEPIGLTDKGYAALGQQRHTR